MRIDILCLFPEMFVSPLGYSITGRAQERGLVQIVTHNIRDYTHDRHRTVDDYPYGGGAGMVLKPEPVFEAVEHVRDSVESPDCPIVLLTPQGRPLSQAVAAELAARHPDRSGMAGEFRCHCLPGASAPYSAHRADRGSVVW